MATTAPQIGQSENFEPLPAVVPLAAVVPLPEAVPLPLEERGRLLPLAGSAPFGRER